MLNSICNKLVELKNHKGFMRYASNTSWMVAEKILRMFVGILVGVWVARYLGPEQFGLLSYAQSFVFLFSVIATLGLDSVVVRDLVKVPDETDTIIGTAFFLKLSASLAVIGLLSICLFVFGIEGEERVIILVISTSLVLQSLNVIDFYFQSRVISKYAAYSNSLSLFLASLLKVLLIINEAPVLAFAAVSVAEVFLVMLGYIYFYRKDVNRFLAWRFDHIYALKLLKETMPLILAGVINSFYMKIDQVMIKEILDSYQVGIYAAAVRLSEAWYGIGVLICNSLFPALVAGKEISKELYTKRLTRLFVFLVALSYLVSAFVLLFSEDIIVFLYGYEYANSSTVLAVHIISTMFVYLGVASGRWLIIEKKAMLNFYRNILGALTNIFMNIVLIRKYGVVGAATASLFSYFFAFYIFDLFVKDTRKLFVYKTKSMFLLVSKK